MNLFNGMTDRQILSAILTFLLFNFYVVLMVVALGAFYLSSRPRRGRVRTAPILHFTAALWFLMCFISMVWAAPAEKSFVDADNPDINAHDNLFNLHADRFQKVIIGLCFAFVGVLCMLAGAWLGSRQRREIAQRALVEAA